MIGFTVFTPVYNGGSTIHRVYQSLLRQTFADFEWLIIDDGSTDNTIQVIEQMVNESKIKIRFFKQDNMHKFYSLLRGIELAEGKYFLIADADDEFTADTLMQFNRGHNILEAKKEIKYIGVNCLCADTTGHIIGDPYPNHQMISDHSEMIYKYKVMGEKWGSQVTSILKQFKFPPEFFNNGYIPEGILWNRIASEGYKILFLNEPLRIYYNEKARHSISTQARQDVRKNSFGAMQSLKTELNHQLKYFVHNPVHFIKSTVLYYEASRLQNLNILEAAGHLRGMGRLLYWIASPVSMVMFHVRNKSSSSKHAPVPEKQNQSVLRNIE